MKEAIIAICGFILIILLLPVALNLLFWWYAAVAVYFNQ